VGGGGTVWDSMVYDPELNLLYVGTGNSAPYAIEVRSPSGGDNLYLSSILAINPDDGRLVWHYQTTPGDSWDFTATMNMILTDLDIDGVRRKVLMQAPKNGFFYVLDRQTGELLSANNYVPVTWASHVDMATGRPVKTENADYFTTPKVQSPPDPGGHGWQPMAYSPDTGLVYIPAWELYWLRLNMFPEGYSYHPGEANMGVMNFPAVPQIVDALAAFLPYDADYLKEIIDAADAPPDREFLRAWDPVKGEVAWEVENIGFQDGGGVLATGGGLVFQGHATGVLSVHDAATGALLREIDTGTGMMAAPMTYAVDGAQYVAVMAGMGGAGNWAYPEYAAAYKRGNAGRIIAFRLDGGAVPMPPVIPPEPFPAPPESDTSPEQLARGEFLMLTHCSHCHPSVGPGLLPDLRRLSAEKHALFEEIVLGGLLRTNGMADFSALLDREQVGDIHAWLIELQSRAHAAQQPAPGEEE
jgi:quinohemoprotein ethanol dehydrogenase